MKYLEVVNQNLHLQGFTTDGKRMYWSFTDALVMTTMSGTVLRQVPTATFWEHLGGIDYIDGKIYGAAMFYSPDPNSGLQNFASIHVYDADTLAVERIIPLHDVAQEMNVRADGFHGIGAVCEGYDPEDGERALFLAGAFDADSTLPGQYIFSYTFDGKRKNRYLVPTGPTMLGIQNIDRDPVSGCYYMTSYGAHRPDQNPNTFYKISPDLTTVLEQYTCTTAYGLHCLGNERFYLSLQSGVNGHRNGYAYEADLELIRTLAPHHFREKEIREHIMARFDQPMGL